MGIFWLDCRERLSTYFRNCEYVLSLSLHMLCMICSPYLIQRTSRIRYWNALFKTALSCTKTCFHYKLMMITWFLQAVFFMKSLYLQFVSVIVNFSVYLIRFLFGMRLCSSFSCYEPTFERRNRFEMSSMVPFQASTWFHQRTAYSGSFSTQLCHPVFHILCSEALNMCFLVYLRIFTLMLEYFFLRGYWSRNVWL